MRLIAVVPVYLRESSAADTLAFGGFQFAANLSTHTLGLGYNMRLLSIRSCV